MCVSGGQHTALSDSFYICNLDIQPNMFCNSKSYTSIYTFDQALGKPSATTSRKAGTALATRRIQVHSRSRQTRSLHPVLNIYIRMYISTHAGFAYNRPRMNLSGLLYHYSFMHKLKYILADAIPNILVLPKNQVIVGGIWVRQVTGA